MLNSATFPRHTLCPGLPVFGADGKPWGTIAAVGPRVVTIAQGARGDETFDLPIGLVARAEAGRVELAMPVIDPK